MRLRWLLAPNMIFAVVSGGAAAGAESGVPPGFYDVAGGRRCLEEFGSRVFVPHHGRALILQGGRRRRLAVSAGAATNLVIEGTPCTLSFRNNDPATVGIGARLLAHRGDARVFPANTLPAFEQALVQGFAGFELDIHLSRDGVAVVSHDDALGVASSCRGRISDSDLADLATCRVLRSPLLPGTRFLARRARIPAPLPILRQVLLDYLRDPRAAQIVVDIKVKGERKRLAEALRNARPWPLSAADEQRLTFISLDAGDIPLLRQVFPSAHIALESDQTVSGLIDEPEGDHWTDPAYDTFSLNFNSLYDLRLKAVKLFRGENLRPARRFRRFYARNREAACPRRLLGWTINNGAGVRALRRYAFNDILTDLSYEGFIRRAMRDPSEAMAGAAHSGLAEPPPRCPRVG